jgi:dTDP-glucose 4,6-dehydratase
MRFVVTGGAGFIGSHFVRTALQESWADQVVVLDALTYAGNLANLAPVEKHPGYSMVRADITDPQAVRQAVGEGTDAIFHFAAESHVDRSIEAGSAFVHTNVLGTQVLLDVARLAGVQRFVHVSTDEVYGSLSLEDSELFCEDTPLCPTSPYAASKASSDLMVLAAVRTHKLNAVITRCSNNYGPYQFPEKFIPLFITNALDGRPVPLYGDGKNVRDWVHVDAHVRGIQRAFERGRPGQIFNLGGECERANIDIAHMILKIVGADVSLLHPVEDRLAHDRRYAIDVGLARDTLDFIPGPPIEERLEELVRWYADHRSWWESIKAGTYKQYYARMYGARRKLSGSGQAAHA